MDSSTKNLKDMIQRMTELEGSGASDESKKQQLDEAISVTADTADELASLAKMLGNAGMNDQSAQSAQPMPARQDMERLAGIMGDPEPMVTGEDDIGGIEKKIHGLPPGGESVDEMSSGSGQEVEKLLGLVKQVAQGDRRAQSEFKDTVSNEFTGVDAGRLLQKLSKMDSRKQAEVIEELVKRGQRQVVSKSSASMKEPTFEDNEEGALGGKEEAVREWYNKYSKYKNDLGDALPDGLVRFFLDSGASQDMMEVGEMAKAEKYFGKDLDDWGDEELDKFWDVAPISDGMVDDLATIAGQSVDEALANEVQEIIQGSTDEGYDNEPDEEQQDHQYMTKDLSGGLNRQKRAYAKAQDGDNAMAVEGVKDRLYAQLSEKKKADKDYDGDGKIETPKAEYQGSKIKAAKEKGNLPKDKKKK
jgi:hypothetical protein